MRVFDWYPCILGPFDAGSMLALEIKRLPQGMCRQWQICLLDTSLPPSFSRLSSYTLTNRSHYRLHSPRTVVNTIANGSKHAMNTRNRYQHHRQGSKHAMNTLPPVEHDHGHDPSSTCPLIPNSQPRIAVGCLLLLGN